MDRDYLFGAGLSDKAYQYIIEKINNLELPPDSKINMVKLAEELKVSRTPVKNALERLADEGYVSRTRGGFCTPPIDPVDFMSLLEARQMIESTAAYMAADVITKGELDHLKELINRGEQARASGDMSEFARCDNLFHEKIVEASRNSYIISMYKVLVPRIHRYRHALPKYRKQDIKTDSSHAKEKHMAIYGALKARYASLARSEMEEHLRFNNQYLFDMRGTGK